MIAPDGKLSLGPWLPDLPFYENPGLVEAKNVIPVDGAYKNYLPVVTSGDALAARCRGAFSATDSLGSPYLYVGTATKLYVKAGTNWTDKSGATTFTLSASDYWRFAQFEDKIVATSFSDVPKRLTVGAGTNFVDLASTGTAPKARHVGVIGNFVMLGDTDDGTHYPYRVQWCAIGDCTDWPTPGTIDAGSKQAGEHFLKAEHGAVTGIVGGETFGLVFQQRAITRFSYVGGQGVWQINTFEKNRGCWSPGTLVQAGGLNYFMANDGFYVTDGQSVKPIGNGSVDKFAIAEMDQSYLDRFCSGVDFTNKCVIWAYPATGGVTGDPNRLLYFNYAESRWSHAEESNMELLFQGLSTGYTLDQLDAMMTSLDDYSVSLDSPIFSGGVNVTMAFGTDHKLGAFAGTSGTAVFETGEQEPNPGGYATVYGARPLVSGNPSSITLSIGHRTQQDNQGRTFSTPVTPNSRTLNCDFIVTGRYVSARMSVVGNFDRALGIQYAVKPAGF